MGILTKGEYTVTNLEDGRGISKTESTYQKSTSGTVVPTGTWTTNIPSVGAGEYLWTRTLFTYTDNTTSSTYTVGRMGTNGNNGLGISNNTVHYQASSSGTTAPTGTWTATIPTVAANQYLWTRTTITYTDGSTSVSYSVGKMGADGKDAQLLYLTASSQIQAFDKDDKPKTTQAITISAKLQNASGTATFVAIPYIGNVAQTAITLGGTGNDRTLLPSQWTNTQWTTIAITATLGSLTDTLSIIKIKDGATGAKGSDGIAGKDGVGIQTTQIMYAQSTSGTTPPLTGWTAQVPTLIKGQYLWTQTTWVYTDNTGEAGYTVSYNAKDGNNGTDGIAGKDGVGISSTKVEYVGSTSGTTKPTTGWSTTIPTVAEGNYLWTKTTWTYTDSTSEVGYSVAKMGAKGDTGAQGPQGPQGPAGAKGDPTGIISSSTEPTSPYVGMLWLNTGTSGGRVQNATYRWNGSSWGLYILRAENIVSTNLAAITAQLGNVTAGSITNTGSFVDGTTTINYTSKIDGMINIDWKVSNTAQNGTTSFRPDSVRSQSWNDSAKTQPTWAWSIGSGGLYIASKGSSNLALGKTTYYGPEGISITNDNPGTVGTVQLGYLDLMTVGLTQLTPASGYTVYSTSGASRPTARRSVGRVITLSGAFKNNSAVTTTTEWLTIGTVPDWASPAQHFNLIVQGSQWNRFQLQITPDGLVQWCRYGNSSGTSTPAGSWLNISCVYTAGV